METRPAPRRSRIVGRGGASEAGGEGCPSSGSTVCGARCVCQRHNQIRRPDVTASSSPVEWKAIHETTKSKLSTRTHFSVSRSHMRTDSSREPDASTLRSRGWNLIDQGVRRWPFSVHTSPHVAQRKTLTVWSPCVLAKRTPSLLNASAIVDFASGLSLQ